MASMPDPIVTIAQVHVSLRDYFAGLAMSQVMQEVDWFNDSQSAAEKSYEIADAMLRERRKTR